MKKTTLKLFSALLLSAMLLLCFASCAERGEEIPDGMKIACCSGADYRLYVPTSWTLNNDYGVSGAYRILGSQSTVSVNKYEATDEVNAEIARRASDAGSEETPAFRLQSYFDGFVAPAIASQELNGRLTMVDEECVATVLDGVNAYRFRFSGTIHGEELQFLTVVAERGGSFYVFSFTATSTMYENCIKDVEKILEEFIFADPYLPEDFIRKLDDGTDAPEGMKPAFSTDVAYRFYVPTDWELDLDQKIYAAFVPDDRTSVSVVPYVPDNGSMSPTEFFTMMWEELTRTFDGEKITLVSYRDTELGGRAARDYEYTLSIDGSLYRYRQIITTYRGTVYSMTYTALDVHYEAHLGELDAMIAAFSFR